MCGSNGPLGGDLGEPLAGERVGERAVHEPDALLELRLLVVHGGLERALEVVEHGQERLDEPRGGAGGERRLLARHPLAVVVELGLQALQRVEVLVALARERDHVGLRLRAGRGGLLGLPGGGDVHHRLLVHRRLLDRLARVTHSSTTSYSASSTTSSSVEEPSWPLPEACCWADACA